MVLAVAGRATNHAAATATTTYCGEALTAVALTSGCVAVYHHGALAATLSTGTVQAVCWWGDGALLLCVRGDILHRYLRHAEDAERGDEAFPVHPRLSFTHLTPTRLPAPGTALAWSSFGVAVATADTLYLLGDSVHELQPVDVVKVKCLADVVAEAAAEEAPPQAPGSEVPVLTVSAAGDAGPTRAPPAAIRALEWSYAGSALCVVVGRGRVYVAGVERNDAALRAAAMEPASPGGDPPPPPPPFAVALAAVRHPPHAAVDDARYLPTDTGVNTLLTLASDGCLRFWTEHRGPGGAAAYFLAHSLHSIAACAPIWQALPPPRGTAAVADAPPPPLFGLCPARGVHDDHREATVEHALLAVDAADGALVKLELQHLGAQPRQAVRATRRRYPTLGASRGMQGAAAPPGLARVYAASQGSHPDDVQLVAGLADGSVIAHSIADGRAFTFTGHRGAVREVAAHPHRPLVATLDTHGEVIVWLENAHPGYLGSARSGAPRQLLQVARHQGPRLAALQWAPTSLTLFAAPEGGDALLALTLHVQGCPPRGALPHYPPAYSLTAAPLPPPVETLVVADLQAEHRRRRRAKRRAEKVARRESRLEKRKARQAEYVVPR